MRKGGLRRRLPSFAEAAVCPRRAGTLRGRGAQSNFGRFNLKFLKDVPAGSPETLAGAAKAGVEGQSDWKFLKDVPAGRPEMLAGAAKAGVEGQSDWKFLKDVSRDAAEVLEGLLETAFVSADALKEFKL